MNGTWIPLAEGVHRTVFEWGRIQSNTDWIAPVAVSVAIGLFVRALYLRDAVELRPTTGWLLTVLRTAVFVGLLILYLQPQWRTEREVTRNSRALVLIDTSSSMGLTDVDLDASAAPTATSRIDQVASTLNETGFFNTLCRVHDVVVLRFDEDIGRIVSLDKHASNTSNASNGSENPDSTTQEPGTSPTHPIDWQKALLPTGRETRLGEALRQLVHEERGAPVSGIVLVSDGGQNAGTSVETAIGIARDAGISVFPVGLGSNRRPANVRVDQLSAVPRAYPGDPYTVTALIQVVGGDGPVDGVTGRSALVELLRRKADEPDARPGSGTPIDSQQIVLGEGGRAVSVRFEVTPEAIGRQTLCVRVAVPRADHQPDDNFRETEVEVVDRKDRVLLFAGGPTREYRFLRTQLFRDASMTSDIFLQTAAEGISQEADTVLDNFPKTREAMFAYDCLVAFDPDWLELDPDQIDLLEQWIAEQGGGMIVIAGAVHAGEPVLGWIQDPAMEKIRALYPVEFPRRTSLLESASYAGQEPWPLEFTREGLDADYLGLEEDAASSLRAWSTSPGVYSYCPVRGPKAAATVLARFSDPRARQGDEQPVYFAEQFYGSGRIFYLGSGEMWRLRRVNESYFERFYTNLIRHVSQGRLLRESSRGALMVGQDRYTLGKTVEIRAQLTDAQLEPLDVARVAMELFQPSGDAETVELHPDPRRVGMYVGQFTVLEEGDYRLELAVPESVNERITRHIQVTLPDLERQAPERNDTILARIADGTGGRYYESLPAAWDPKSADSLANRLKDRTQTVILTAAPDSAWEKTWLTWLMIVLCGLLCLEWLIRRLCKLA